MRQWICVWEGESEVMNEESVVVVKRDERDIDVELFEYV